VSYLIINFLHSLVAEDQLREALIGHYHASGDLQRMVEECRRRSPCQVEMMEELRLQEVMAL
jgi:hypothetical protein